MNCKLHYLYRDGGNYKQFHFEVFSNINNFPIAEIEKEIRNGLIEGSWFYANKWQLKALHLYKWDESMDHNLHEFESVENTNEEPTRGDISDFLALIRL